MALFRFPNGLRWVARGACIYETPYCDATSDLMFDNEEIFHPFRIADAHEDYYVADIDPDLNYFNKFDFKLATSWYYYSEYS